MIRGVGKRHAFLLAIVVSVVIFSSLAMSAEYPKKPIRIIVTAGPGGGEDVEARGLSPFLEKHLGVNIMI